MCKLLACGLILSTLISCGSICFAMNGENDFFSEVVQPLKKNKDPHDKSSDGPQMPQVDRYEKKQETCGNKKRFKDLRKQAIALLNGYYDLEYGLIWYSIVELSSMRIFDLNEDCTILTVDNMEKELPSPIPEILNEYLALRTKLFPETMGDTQALFQCDIGTSSRKGRTQLDPNLILADGKEIMTILSNTRDNILVSLIEYSIMRGFSPRPVSEFLSRAEIKDVDFSDNTLKVDGHVLQFDEKIADDLWHYLRIREGLFPEITKDNNPLFIQCRHLKKANPIPWDNIRAIYLKRKVI